MKLRLVATTLCLLPTLAFALDSNIFEKNKEGKSFSAKVKVVREVSEDVEVFFDSDKAKGAFTLPKSMGGYGAALQTLEAAKKSGASVSVIADEDNRIQSVAAAAGGALAAPNPEDAQKELQKQYDAILKKK